MNSTEETNKLIGRANDLKVSAIVLTPMVGQGDVIDKMELALKHSDLPIILYNNPAIQNGLNLEFQIIKKYADNSRIIGIKDSSTYNNYKNRIIEITSKSFSFFEGSESQFINFYGRKSSGLVASSANIYPSEFKKFVINPDEENLNIVKKLKSNIKKTDSNSVQAIKTLLNKAGIIDSDEIY